MDNKSLAIAGGILAVILVGVFLLFGKGAGKSDILIPSPTPVGSPGLELLNQKNQMTQQFPLLKAEDIQGKKVHIKTSKGDIVFELFADAPVAASNFIYLTEKRFYDGLTFHRREEGFVIQGGDPSGNGAGGPGYKFADEPVTREYTKGIVAMANSDPNTNGSQFFIMLADTPTLPKAYTIFGQVVEGQEVVDKIIVGDKMTSVTIE